MEIRRGRISRRNEENARPRSKRGSRDARRFSDGRAPPKPAGRAASASLDRRSTSPPRLDGAAPRCQGRRGNRPSRCATLRSSERRSDHARGLRLSGSARSISTTARRDARLRAAKEAPRAIAPPSDKAPCGPRSHGRETGIAVSASARIAGPPSRGLAPPGATGRASSSRLPLGHLLSRCAALAQTLRDGLAAAAWPSFLWILTLARRSACGRPWL